MNDQHWVKYQFAAHDQEQTLQEGILAAHLLQKDVRQLSSSRPVTVRYDPENPALARIEMKMRWEESVGIVMFFTLVLLIGLLGVVVSRQTCIPECVAQPQPVYDVQPLVAGSVPAPTATVPGMPEMIPTYRVPGGFYAGGDPAAPVTVMQFSDFQCESCARFILGETYSRLIADYVDAGKVYYIFHDFPLNQHANAGKAAEAARCAGAQGAYWPMYTLLFAHQSDWSSGPPEPVFTEFATQMGLARAPFAACLASRRYTGDIVNAYQSARNAGICSTPTFLVNGYRVAAATGLLEAIDAALAEEQFTVSEKAKP
jgi:protein-disulfide isomerase